MRTGSAHSAKAWRVGWFRRSVTRRWCCRSSCFSRRCIWLRLRPPLHALPHVASVFVYVLLGCALLHLSMRGVTVYGGHLAGGVLGEVLGEVLRSLLGLVGAYVICVVALAITFILRTSFSLVGSLRAVSKFIATNFSSLGEFLGRSGAQLLAAWNKAQAIEQRDRARSTHQPTPDALAEVRRSATARAARRWT